MGRTLHEVFRIREVRDHRTGGTVVALNPPDTGSNRDPEIDVLLRSRPPGIGSRADKRCSDTKLPFVSVKLTASSRGDRSGSSRARLTIAVSILSGILFQIRRGLGLPSTRASIPPSWYRLYQS